MENKDIPYISRDQMIRVDELMVHQYGIELIQMMENAGRHLAELARTRFLDGDARGKKIALLAGSGGNGGGSLVCGRNLHNWGADVSVYLTRSVDQLSGTIQKQARIAQGLDVPINVDSLPDPDDEFDLIIDGIIGYSLEGAPRGRAADMIRWANDQDTPVLALDLPSGLDATTGEVFTPGITATVTMTLALPKLGLKNPLQPVVGELYLADIGVPAALYSDPSLGIDVGTLFHAESVLKLN